MCVLTAAGRVSCTGRARFPLLLDGTPALGPSPWDRRVLATESRTSRTSSSKGVPGTALRRDPSQAWQPEGEGAAALSSISFPLRSVSGQSGRWRGPEPLPRQEGAWATHRKANYRSKMLASSWLRLPEAAGVSLHQTPVPARESFLGGLRSQLSSWRLAKGCR